MNKVLLIYEDYAELNSTQGSLKKVGFDCVGISSEFSISEQVLSFHPDVIVGCGKGPKVSTISVGRRLKEMHRWNGKTLLIFPVGIKPRPQDLIKIRMDMVLEAPVPIHRLLQVLGNLTNQDSQSLIEKLNKSHSQEGSQRESNLVSSHRAAAEEKLVVSGKVPAPESETATSSVPSFSMRDSGSSQEVDWSQIENQIFGQTPEASKPLFPLGNEAKASTFSMDLGKTETEKLHSSQADEEFPEKTDGGEPQLLSKATPPDFMAALPSQASQEAEPADLGSPAQIVQEPPTVDSVSEGTDSSGAELAEAATRLPDKMKRYQEMVQSLKFSPVSELKKTSVRQKQRDLMKDWRQEDLEAQDEARREFTKALFKKK